MGRKWFLILAPVFIGISWRLGGVFFSLNATIDEVLMAWALILIVSLKRCTKDDMRVVFFRPNMLFLFFVGITFVFNLLIYGTLSPVSVLKLFLLNLKHYVFGPIIFYAAFLSIRKKEEARRLLGWLCIIGVIVSIYSILQYHLALTTGTYNHFLMYSNYGQENIWKLFAFRRAYGPLGSSSSLARYLIIPAILCIFTGLGGKDERGTPLYLGFALICIYAIGLSQTRGAFVALMVAVGLYFLWNRKTANIPYIIAFGIIAAIIFPNAMLDRFQTALMAENINETVNGRIDMWQWSAMATLEQNPITGLGHQLDIVFDNDFSWIFYQGGLLLLVPFLYLVAAPLLGALRLMRHRIPMIRDCGGMLFLMAAGMVLAAVTGRTYFSPKVSMEFWFAAAVVIRLAQIQAAENRRGPARRRTQRIGRLYSRRHLSGVAGPL